MTADQFRSKIREITNTTTSDYADASLIRDLNAELSLIQVMILRDRGVLEFDDTNYTDLPVATFTITAGTREYKITEDENSNALLTKHKVGVLKNGQYEDVPRLQVGEGSQTALLTKDTDTADVPRGYYEIGTSIVFKDMPATSTTGKVWFDREMSFLTTADTTKVPGVPSAYHNLAAYRTAMNYAIDKTLPNQNAIQNRIDREQQLLEQYEENRRSDEPTIISVPTVNGL